MKMPRVPNKTGVEHPPASSQTVDENDGPEVRSYYYDDAHGYEDYEPEEECGNDDEADDDGPERSTTT